ncbi:hypothetical protein ACFWGN_11840 [Oerskovia sp. NPDC060338]|uniref:hypothetical protein n=1 Tax=Oerskovia sp. NPDC060338 TaxID=3347100 RepID=UPI00365B00BC
MARTTRKRATLRSVPSMYDPDVDSALTHTADLFGICPTCSARAGSTVHWPCPKSLTLAGHEPAPEPPTAA